MIAIEKLRYVRLGVQNVRSSADFATRMMGLQPIELEDEAAKFRSDFRDHSLELFRNETSSEALAVEVRTLDDLREAVKKLEAAGYEITPGTEAECEDRRVKAMARFQLRNGLFIEVVWRALDSGWRYHGTRDAGITEFFGVALCSTDIEADTELWTEIFNGKISDYVGDGVYINFDEEHHRISIHPSDRDAILEMKFKVEALDNLMQNKYFLQKAQVAIVAGPGRNPASGQAFLTTRGPEAMLYGFVCDGDKFDRDADRLPRQFAFTPDSFCAWGSTSEIPEYASEVADN